MERRGGRRVRSEWGQGTSEFAAIVVVAAISVAAVVLAATLSSSSLRDTIATTICQITTLGHGACEETGAGEEARRGDGDLPWFLDPSLAPEEAATRGRYVALGDSFSSGEGGTDYQEWTDEDNLAARDAWDEAQKSEQERPYHNMCHRSAQAYPQRLEGRLEFDHGLTFAACSGAATADFTEPNASNDNEPAQLDHLDDTTSLVTFSIGGNDAEFAATLRSCVFRGLNPFSSCAEDADTVEANVQRALDNLGQLLPQIRERAPNARILVLGYPRFFPEEQLRWHEDGTVISPSDTRFINAMIDRMNAGIDELVTDYNADSIAGNAEYVDVSAAFTGCEIGTADPCMNNVQLWNNGSFNQNGSYHPNDLGHERYAEVLEEAITSGP